MSGEEQTRGRTQCAECGAEFECGALAGAERCWCSDLPKLEPRPDAPHSCLCKACLMRVTSESP